MNRISKSGTTAGPAIAFRVFKEIPEKKYGREEAVKRIYVTADKAGGAFKNPATGKAMKPLLLRMNWRTFLRTDSRLRATALCGTLLFEISCRTRAKQ